MVQDILIPVLTKLINEVLNSGEYPDILKCSRVIPIFKSGIPSSVGNYRPISVVSILSKIIEKILKIRMLSFIKKYNMIDKQQYGFLEKSNTQSAALDVIHFVSCELDQGKYVIIILIDLQKAFDVICHTVTIKKLELMGFRGSTLKLLQSYLSNRSQIVCLDEVESRENKIGSGVPQGSVLGPLIYTLHVLSLKNAQLKANYFTFADDTLLVYSGENMTILQDTINEDLKRYNAWLSTNKLKINIKKTKYLMLKQKNKPDVQINIVLGDKPISKVECATYLGLQIDNKLNWYNHYESLYKKIIPLIGQLFRCRSFLDESSKYKIYNSFFLTQITYMLPIYGTCNKTTFKKLETLQNKFCKILFEMNYRTPSTELYNRLKILPIKALMQLEQAKLIYRIKNNQQKLNNEIRLRNTVHSYQTRQNLEIYYKTPRTELGDNNPLHQAFKTYNNLPDSVKNCATEGLFIKNIKKLLQHNGDQ